MGGYGSGRTGYKQKAGACKSISVNGPHGEGRLIVGRAGNWIWSLDGEETGRISYQMTEGGLGGGHISKLGESRPRDIVIFLCGQLKGKSWGHRHIGGHNGGLNIIHKP